MLTAKMVGGSADGQTYDIPLTEKGYPRGGNWEWRIANPGGGYVSYYFDRETPRDDDGLLSYRLGSYFMGPRP